MDEASAIYPDTFDTSPTPDEIAAEAMASTWLVAAETDMIGMTGSRPNVG